MFQLHLLKAGSNAVAFKYDLHRYENVCGGSVLDDEFVPDDEGVAAEHFVANLGGSASVSRLLFGGVGPDGGGGDGNGPTSMVL
jgi:hypothetical protein